MMKKALITKEYSARCNHKAVLQVVDKLNEKEAEALFRLIQNVELDSKRACEKEIISRPWKLFM